MSADGAAKPMDPNEIAESFRTPLDQMHAYIDLMEDGPVKTRAQRLAAVAHGALEALATHMGDHGVIAFDGTPKPDPKP